MSQRANRKRIEDPSPGESDRRIAQRYAASDVPWIVAVKPAAGEAGQLVNISQTGLLIDTRDRLSPGRRTTLLASTKDQKVQRWPVVVVRTHVVKFNQDGTPLYRTALRFEGAFDWKLSQDQDPDPADMAEHERVPALCFDGPLDGGLSTAQGSQAASIGSLTEDGCTVRVTCRDGIAAGDQVMVALLFSPSFRMTLRARVEAHTEENLFAVRFGSLSADERRLLRVEIRGAVVRCAARGAMTGPPGAQGQIRRLAVEQGSTLIAIDGNLW